MSTRDHPDWWRPMGGQNSQDSTLERRSLIWNDDGIEDGTVPGGIHQATTYRGKFFTRGCRGMLEQIQLYCTGNAANTIILRYSPHPGIGPFGEVTLVPAAGWAWQDFDVEEMWNYDSLFIWVYQCEVGIDWAYDSVQPYDGHLSSDNGVTWEDAATRPFIRAVLTGETPGDVPVSGIVNTIKVPNVGTDIANGLANLPNNVWTDVCEFHGAGEVLEVQLIYHSIAVPAAGVVYSMAIDCDGNQAYFTTNRHITQSVVAVVGRNSVGELWQTATVTHICVRIPVNFRRHIVIAMMQSTGGAINGEAQIYANVVR